MAKTQERCTICDDLTGGAGKGEDSLYLDLPNGESYGPLCVACHDAGCSYVGLWAGHSYKLQAKNSELHRRCQRAESAVAQFVKAEAAAKEQ